MDRARVFVWQFRDALSTRQRISLKISTKIIFDLSQWQQNHNTTNDKKSCHFFFMLTSQWLCRKSTTWFMSRRMRKHFSPVKAKTILLCYVWTCVFFETKQKNLRFQKYPDTWNLDITNDFLYPSNSKICEKEPQFNLEIFSFLKMLCYVRKIMKA